jgi:hypothetical protein
MFTCHRKTIQAVAFFLLLAAPALGGTAILPLQDLLGTYAYDILGTVPPPYYKSATVQTGYGLSDVTKVHLVLEGTSSPAIVRGDGVLRENEVAVTYTGLSILAQICYDNYLDFPDLAPGGFAYVSYDFNAPYDTHRPIPGPPGPDYFSATIEMSLCPTNPTWGPPAFIVPPAEGTVVRWYDGLILVEPATATVTNAYLVLEGPTLPEPATLSLLALGGLLALRRKARR